jgi:alpha-D-xyloside xylohydrolase
MPTTIDWQAIARPLDVFDFDVPRHFIRRWQGYTRTGSGVRFQCQTAAGDTVAFQVSVIQPDVLRVQASRGDIHPASSEMLVQDSWPIPDFTLQESGDTVVLTTDRVQAVFHRFPWQMQVFHVAAGPTDLPFFSQSNEDRSYGPDFEVPPVGFSPLGEDGWSVHEAVNIQPDEAFYGFGEKFTPLNKRGDEIVSWAVDSGSVTSHRAYKNVPFFMSTAGYGLFVHSSHPMVYRMGTESSASYSVHIASDQLDYFLMYGPDFQHILSRYTALTGRAPVPPKWSFGFWISRAGYRSQAEALDIIDEMRARDFPCDVISLDPWWMGDPPWSTLEWDAANFPDPAQMMADLREKGVRTCLWVTPYFPQGSASYAVGKAKGYFVQRADGAISPVMEAFAGGESAAVDFTNPAAVDWYLGELEALLDMGAAVFKTDFGEQAPVDAVYHDGRSGLEMHNLYPLLYNSAVFGLTARKFGRGLTWGRSAYAGSQRCPVQWGGDSYSSFPQMTGQLRALLGYGLSGVPFCSHDVGGFDYPPRAFDQHDVDPREMYSDAMQARLAAFPRDPQLYIRWLQFGAFSSHMRAHGKGAHEPWAFGPEAEAIARQYLKLRYRLLPYLYSEAVRASRSGLPVVRPLVLDYQYDRNVHNVDLQYLFGADVLVAPVVQPDNRAAVYLPEGHWVDYWTKRVQHGGRWIDVDAPLNILPMWVRAGAIIPMGPEMAFVDEKPLDPLTVELYAPGEAGETTIYDEDKPAITVRYERRGDELVVSVAPVPGMVEIVVYNLSIVGALLHDEPVIGRHDRSAYRLTVDGRTGAVVTFGVETL